LGGKILTVSTPKPIDADSLEVMYHLLPLRDNKRTHEDESGKDKKSKKQKKEKNDKKNPKECKTGKVELPPNAKNDANQNICFAFNRIAQFVVPSVDVVCMFCWKVGCFGRHAWPDCNANK